MSTYPIPAGSHQYEFDIKRSRFICFVGQAQSRPQAEDFIRDLRRQHPQAAHVCWAYIAGAPDTTVMSMSDDGEPSGTAGRPMLNVLLHSGLGEIAVAVVRYFGGIKLGTGGLQRAYSDAVTGALKDLPTRLRVPRSALMLTFDYALESQVRHILGQFDTDNEQIDYGQQVSVRLNIAQNDQQACIQMLTNQSAGTIQIQLPDPTPY
ncbi:YigZ family protein [Bowmanella dokdonensis]|uniref:YigZ family protein n=1 Tax=Bowmanella dokdonensis TaxID=751969 RepID=A0A939DQU4_9ALTE|nr:YigZ family protein [Bowmanella dokdonensis]MBN7826236.1 YigZ family protein [Bowmanella dokdonensis]